MHSVTYQTVPSFDDPGKKAFENMLRKGEMLIIRQFYNYEPCSVKRGLNTSTKSIHPGQPARTETGLKLFSIGQFSICPGTSIPHDQIGC